MGAIYLSFSPEDGPLAEKLKRALAQAGIEFVQHNPFSDTELFSKSLDEALRTYDLILLLWSKTARKCRSVERDWTSALVFDKKIVSIILDDTAVPAALLKGELVDFRRSQRNWQRLLGSLKNDYPASADETAHLHNGNDLPALPNRKKTKLSTKNPRQENVHAVKLRSQPLLTFSIENVELMLKKRDFFDRTWRRNGTGLAHHYESTLQFGDQLVIDHKTGLNWQHEGSNSWMTYSDAQQYVTELNASYFGGFTDWRLPTLEEAMSLVEPKLIENKMHISTSFAPEQRYIWTADKQCEEIVWFVAFPNGGVGSCRISNYNSVRAVRESR
ncbi:MAG: DUF1566 domain-containing protein [bacterium]